MLCLRMSGARVPSRFNTSFRYTTRSSASCFSTDIASGAKSCVYPPKFRHWGHAYLGEGFETVIMIRNNSHQPSQTREGQGKLSLYCNGVQQEHEVAVAAESSISLKVSTLMQEVPGEYGKMAFISWLLELDNATCETFWVAYRSSDGAIFGEHGF